MQFPHLPNWSAKQIKNYEVHNIIKTCLCLQSPYVITECLTTSFLICLLALRKCLDVVQITDKSNTISKALGGAQGLAFVYVSVVGTFKACDPKYVVREAKHS